MGRERVTILAAVAAFCLLALDASGTVFIADPDDLYVEGGNPTVLVNGAFPGVTLSTDAPLGAVIALGGGVVEVPGWFPATFGHYAINFPGGACGGCWSLGHAVFRADFATPVNSVEVDFIDRYAGTALLFAYDFGNHLIGEAQAQLLDFSAVDAHRVTLTVAVPGAHIASIVAGANDGTYGVIDQLRWTIPEPATFALLSIGLVSLNAARRRADTGRAAGG